MKKIIIESNNYPFGDGAGGVKSYNNSLEDVFNGKIDIIRMHHNKQENELKNNHPNVHYISDFKITKKLLPNIIINLYNEIIANFLYVSKVKRFVKKNNVGVFIHSFTEKTGILNSNNIKCQVINIQHANDQMYIDFIKPKSKIINFIRRTFNLLFCEDDIFVCFSKISILNIFGNTNKNIKNVCVSRYSKKDIIKNSKSHSIHVNKKKAAFIGRMSEEKNIDFLFEVRNILINKDITLNFYGSDPDGKYINKEGYGGLKSKEELDDIYSELGVLVLASKFEGLPVIISEAFSYGIPVVIVDSFSNAKFLVGNNERGLFSNMNASDFADKISFLLDSKNYNEFSKKCSDFALENFSNDAFKEFWLNITKQFIEEN
ncbi:MAG: glycosyltransferase [Mycoplasma sp.]